MSESVQQHVAELRDRGICQLDNLLTSHQASEARWEAARIASTCGINAPGYIHNGNWATRALELMDNDLNPERVSCILNEQFFLRPRVSNDMLDFVPALADERVQNLLREKLGANFRVTSTMLWVHEPGVVRGAWRGSGPFWPVHASHYPSPYGVSSPHVTMHVLLGDFSAENGGLLALPGSHRRDWNPSYGGASDAAVAVQLEAGEQVLTGRAGSVIVHDSRTWIAVAANRSDEVRWSVEIQLAPAVERVTGLTCAYRAPVLSVERWKRLPVNAQPMFASWVR